MTEFHICHANITKWNDKTKTYLQSSDVGLPQVTMLGETHLTSGKLGEARQYMGKLVYESYQCPVAATPAGGETGGVGIF
eukprot:9160450-Pyramimonas_sp.AAC.1